MLSITVCLDKPTIISFCRRSKKPFSEAFYLYRAQNGEQVLAAALFEVNGDHVSVISYETEAPDDLSLFDGMLRAGLHYASEQGIETGCIPESFRFVHRDLFAKLNYPISPTFNITNFFNKYKNCAVTRQ